MNKVKKYKKEVKFFTIADYEEEEKYLRQQNKNGWKLARVKWPGIYTFESCSREDVIYQLDFSGVSGEEKSSYIQLFEDHKWEYVADMNGWSYFRKPKSRCDGNMSIFSDAQSKLDLIQRVYRRRLLPLIAIFLCCLVPGLSRSGWLSMTKHTDYIIFGAFVALFVIYMLVFIYCGSRFTRLKKKLER